MKVGIQIKLESDANLIWHAADNCRVVITRMQLFVRRIVFTPRGEEEYTKVFLKPRDWTYLREEIYASNSSQQQTGTFKITNAISKPRDVFVWIMNDARRNSQTENPFLFETFSVGTNGRSLSSCQLEVGNGNQYPENEYQPDTQIARVFRDVHKYSYTENEYQSGSLLNRGNFSTIFPFIYFDLRNQKGDIKDGATKLIFKYKLSGGAGSDYTVYALVLYEKDIRTDNVTGKLMIRT